MTKWDTVGGMGTRSSRTEGAVQWSSGVYLVLDLDLAVGRGGFLVVSTAHSPLWEAARTESAAWWMKAWPSSQKGRTKGDTWFGGRGFVSKV
jgi:hypothetical protein